jgi:hypothetical protein
MEKVSSFILRKSDSLPSLLPRKEEDFLPTSTKPQPRFRVRQLLGHCLYRRVVIWTLVVIVLLSITLFNPRITHTPQNVLDLVQLGKGQIDESKAVKLESDAQFRTQGNQEAQSIQKLDGPKKEAVPKKDATKSKKKPKPKHNGDGPHWLDYEQ